MGHFQTTVEKSATGDLRIVLNHKTEKAQVLPAIMACTSQGDAGQRLPEPGGGGGAPRGRGRRDSCLSPLSSGKGSATDVFPHPFCGYPPPPRLHTKRGGGGGGILELIWEFSYFLLRTL